VKRANAALAARAATLLDLEGIKVVQDTKNWCFLVSRNKKQAWTFLSTTLAEMGRRFSGDEKQYAKMMKAIGGVLARAVRARQVCSLLFLVCYFLVAEKQANLLGRLRSGLCAEVWSTLSPVLSSSNVHHSLAVFDAEVHDVNVSGVWRSPFLDEHQLEKKKKANEEEDDKKNDEESEELRRTHVEDGDELVFEKSGNSNVSAVAAVAADSNRLLACPVGKLLVSQAGEDAELLEVF
jgi:hypothetical protein